MKTAVFSIVCFLLIVISTSLVFAALSDKFTPPPQSGITIRDFAPDSGPAEASSTSPPTTTKVGSPPPASSSPPASTTGGGPPKVAPLDESKSATPPTPSPSTPPQDSPEEDKPPPQPPQPPGGGDKKPPAKKEPMKQEMPIEPRETGCNGKVKPDNPKADAEATKDPCHEDKPCGVANCHVPWFQNGLTACTNFVTANKMYEAEKLILLPSATYKVRVQTKKTAAETAAKKCCTARKTAEDAQITTQQNPCVAKLGSGGLLGADLDACKPWILNNCPITDKQQLAQLYQDRNFMSSMDPNAKNLATVKDMVKNGNPNMGDLKNGLKGDLLKSLAPLAGALAQGGGGGEDSPPEAMRVTPESVATDSTQFQFKDLAGQNLKIDTDKQTLARLSPDGVGTVQAPRQSGPTIVTAFTPGSPSTATTLAQGNPSFLSSESLQVPDLGLKVTGTTQSGQGNEGTAVAFYEPTQIPIRIALFMSDPPDAPIFSIHAGLIVPGFVKINPRANAQIDFDGQDQGFATTVTQGMGIPKGSSLMANPANLNVRTNFNYFIDGLKDYDFIAANGLIIWPHSGTPGGKIISSSFGVPPQEYLSKQQQDLVYGKN